MKTRIITISREFGSGGRTVAKRVAVETGFDEKYIEQEGEHAPVKSMLAYAFAARGTQGVMNGMSANDFLWVIQRKVILDLAEKGPCIIVGRCADYILKDRDDCLNVFVHAPMAQRADRIVRLYGESEQTPEKRLTDKDKRRSVYYKNYTGQDWGRTQNYHLSLDSGKLGIENCVKIIVGLVQSGEETEQPRG